MKTSLLVSLLIILLAVWTNQANAQVTTGNPTSASRVGTTAKPFKRVLVNLKGDYKPEGQLDKAARKAQRDAIAAAQDRVIISMNADPKPKSTTPVRLKRRYVTVPGLALELRQDLITKLQQLPDVAAVFDDETRRPALESTTKIIGSRFANHPEFGRDGQGQVVAVLDTGIDRDHPFLGRNRFVSSACYSSTDIDQDRSICPNGEETQIGGRAGENCATMDDCKHGTHVAGIVGGFIDKNGNGQVDVDDPKGVAPRVRFIAITVFHRRIGRTWCGRPGSCLLAYDSDILAGLDRVEVLRDDYPIAAVNMSIGGGEFTQNCDGLVYYHRYFLVTLAMANLRSRDTATVVAAGNESFTNALAFPACISHAVSVGNTQANDVVAPKSNTAAFLKLLAPGTAVRSSVPGTDFEFMSGTSMAAPHVAGLWALMKQQGLVTEVDDILSRLRDTGVNVTEDGVTTPRIDAMKALSLRAVEIDLDNPIPNDTIQLVDARPVTLALSLRRRGFAGQVRIDPRVENGRALDVGLDSPDDPIAGDSLTLTITPRLSANGRYTVNIDGDAIGTGSDTVHVIPRRLTLNITPPAPTVSGLSPTSGPVASFVTITGQNYSSLTRVQFEGSSRVEPQVESSTSLRVLVPVGARTGKIEVINGVRLARTPQFTITIAPGIATVNPSFVPVGARVVVNGANFGTSPTVRINNVAVTDLTVTPTQLRFTVPQTADGIHSLRVDTDQGTATRDFQVGYPEPTVNQTTPARGGKGGTITLPGSSFYAPVRVTFCSIPSLDVSILDTNHVRARVPERIPDTCTVTVMTRGGKLRGPWNLWTSEVPDGGGG